MKIVNRSIFLWFTTAILCLSFVVLLFPVSSLAQNAPRSTEPPVAIEETTRATRPVPARAPEPRADSALQPAAATPTSSSVGNTAADSKKPAPAARGNAPHRLNVMQLLVGNPISTVVKVAPFIVASLVAFWFSVERLVVLRRGRVIPRHFVDRFLELLKTGQLDAVAALELCEKNNSPVAQIFAHGVRKWGKPSVEVEQAIIDGGERQVSQLRTNLRAINGVATITPLMGLLGTVVGMMIGFLDLASTSVAERTETLAVGILTALSTTALGLAIAIPALIVYMYLSGRIDTLVMEMDELSQQVVNRISAESLYMKSHEKLAAKNRPKAEAV